MDTIVPLLQRHPVWTATAALALASAIPAYNDYRRYMALGAGGPPHNVLGWYYSRFIVTPFSQEMISTQMYEAKIHSGESKAYISLPEGRLPRRKGPRPSVASFAVPNRQTNQLPSEETCRVCPVFEN